MKAGRIDKTLRSLPPRGEGTPVRTLGGMRGRYCGKLPVDAPSSVTAFAGRATFPPRGRRGGILLPLAIQPPLAVVAAASRAIRESPLR